MFSKSFSEWRCCGDGNDDRSEYGLRLLSLAPISLQYKLTLEGRIDRLSPIGGQDQNASIILDLSQKYRDNGIPFQVIVVSLRKINVSFV